MQVSSPFVHYTIFKHPTSDYVDFGIILGCKLFVKEISSKARDQLLNTNQVLTEGDIITKINNTNCNDMMSLKEAKKIIDGTKDKLSLTVSREFSNNIMHQPQSSISTTGAVNNFYKGIGCGVKIVPILTSHFDFDACSLRVLKFCVCFRR